MRNFMGYDRRWLDEPHLGDHVGRSVWALGEILSTAWVPAVVGPTERLLDVDRPASSRRRSSLRTGAYAALGLAHLDTGPAQPGGPAATGARDGAAGGGLHGQRRRGLEVVRGRAHATTTRDSRTP